MLSDIRLRFSNAQAITTTAVSTDTVDGQAAADIGAGHEMEAVIRPVGTFAGGTSVVIELQGSNDASPSTFGSPFVLARTRIYTLAEINAIHVNRQSIVLPVPPVQDSTGYRSYRLNYVCDGTFSGASAFTSYIASKADANNKAYPSGYTYQS
jgi:hypothetical protein